LKPQTSSLPKIEVSWGEYFDKLTILEIKYEKISDESKRENIAKGIKALLTEGRSLADHEAEIQSLVQELKEINRKLWDIEEGKRECERKQCFDESFIKLARAVYMDNDKRAAVKKAIDLRLGSDLLEEKSYKPY
jgi:hypothetical protein